TKLPYFQLFIIFLIMFAEPVTCTVIYPFINQLIRETGVTGGDETRTGYFAGVIESVFFVTEALTVFQWGRASDRYGRKPILVLGPLGLALAMLGFGFSKSFWPLVAFRCFQGAFNGNIGVSKTVMAELTDETNKAEVFVVMPLVWSVALSVGPALGGLLASPAVRWPDTFGRIELFRTYPYLLACGSAGLVAFVSYLLAQFGLKETLPSIVARDERLRVDSERAPLLSTASEPDYGAIPASLDSPLLSRTPSESNYTEDSQSSSSSSDDQPLPFRALLIPRVLIPLSNYLFLCFTDMSIAVLRPLMLSTSIEYGGIGFNPYQIGSIMALWGVFNTIAQLGFAAKAIRRFGNKKVFIASYASSLIILLTFPLMSWLAARAGRADRWVWLVVVVHFGFTILTYTCYGCIHIFIMDSAPTKGSLGATNALSQMLGNVVRSLAPTVASSLFSISIQKHLAGGFLVYWILIAITLVGVRYSFRLP
ncbi:MFS general substrate transporter, partial [Pluteus cervinus]